MNRKVEQHRYNVGISTQLFGPATYFPSAIRAALGRLRSRIRSIIKTDPRGFGQQDGNESAKYVFGLLEDRRENKQDVYAFGVVANKVATYFEMGSVIETPPDLLLSELTVYCKTPEDHSVTPFIVSLCKSYKYLYDKLPDNVAVHEQYLGIVASGLRKGTGRFFARNAQYKNGSGEAPTRTGSLGRGFIISPDGYILTNNHVIEDATRIMVAVPGHGPVEASVVVSDPSNDLALLKLPLPNLPYLALADSNLVHVLDTVYVLGYPLTSELGRNVSASEGKINAIRREGRVFQFDADVNPGIPAVLFSMTKVNVVKVKQNDTLVLRSVPGTAFRSVGEIPPDETDIIAFDEDKIWDGDTWRYPIEWHGILGYVGGSHLRIAH